MDDFWYIKSHNNAFQNKYIYSYTFKGGKHITKTSINRISVLNSTKKSYNQLACMLQKQNISIAIAILLPKKDKMVHL